MLRRTSFKPAYMVKIQPIDIEWRTKSSGLGSAFILIIVVVKKDRRCDQVICQIHDDPDVNGTDCRCLFTVASTCLKRLHSSDSPFAGKDDWIPWILRWLNLRLLCLVHRRLLETACGDKGAAYLVVFPMDLHAHTRPAPGNEITARINKVAYDIRRNVLCSREIQCTIQESWPVVGTSRRGRSIPLGLEPGRRSETHIW